VYVYFTLFFLRSVLILEKNHEPAVAVTSEFNISTGERKKCD